MLFDKTIQSESEIKETSSQTNKQTKTYLVPLFLLEEYFWKEIRTFKENIEELFKVKKFFLQLGRNDKKKKEEELPFKVLFE
jgi:hypothetical protein